MEEQRPPLQINTKSPFAQESNSDDAYSPPVAEVAEWLEKNPLFKEIRIV